MIFDVAVAYSTLSIILQEENMYVCMYVCHGYADHLVIDGS